MDDRRKPGLQNGGANRLPCVDSTLGAIIAPLPKFVNNFAGKALLRPNTYRIGKSRKYV